MAPEGSVGVELGVASGQLSRRFMDLGHFSAFHAVDRWSDRNHSEKEYQGALALLPDVEVHRADVIEWLKGTEDESFGFIYIDCYAHNGQEGGSILEAAWPKLQEGGLFAGDDYEDKYMQTVRAVDEFAAIKDKEVLLYDKHLGQNDSPWDQSKSWYFRK